MSTLLAFLSSLFTIPSLLGISPIECRTSQFPTLTYHHIREYTSISDMAAKNISVSPEEFKEQIQYLKENGYKTITSKDIVNDTVPCKSVMITFDDGYYEVFTQAYPIMQKYNYIGVIGVILARVDESDYLFGSDIRHLQKAGWEIASHTWHHPNLSLLDEKYIPYQIGQSKKDLEKWFHTTVSIFIYPGGRYRFKTLDIIQSSGYKYAFTTQAGESSLTGSKLEMKRIDILPGTGIEKFAQLLNTKPQIIVEK